MFIYAFIQVYTCFRSFCIHLKLIDFFWTRLRSKTLQSWRVMSVCTYLRSPPLGPTGTCHFYCRSPPGRGGLERRIRGSTRISQYRAATRFPRDTSASIHVLRIRLRDWTKGFSSLRKSRSIATDLRVDLRQSFGSGANERTVGTLCSLSVS